MRGESCSGLHLGIRLGIRSTVYSLHLRMSTFLFQLQGKWHYERRLTFTGSLHPIKRMNECSHWVCGIINCVRQSMRLKPARIRNPRISLDRYCMFHWAFACSLLLATGAVSGLAVESIPNMTVAPKAGKVELFPEDALRPGMKGVAWTVFQGTKPEPVPVEIVGVWENGWGPRQDI